MNHALTHRPLGFRCTCHGQVWADPAKLLSHVQREQAKGAAARYVRRMAAINAAYELAIGNKRPV
jgi:hypothetical protein